MKKFAIIKVPRYGLLPDGRDLEQKRLNQFGEEGWQLVSVTELDYYFTQEKKEEVSNVQVSRSSIHYDYSIHD